MTEYGPISDEYELMDAEDFKALLRVVRVAEMCCLRLKDEPMNGGAAGMVYKLMEALEALPEHLKTVDKK